MKKTHLLIFVLSIILPGVCQAASRAEIDAKVEAAMEAFYEHSPAGKKLARQAHGILIFPSVVKAGIGIGGEYGEGALQVGGQTVAYYNIATASVGFQLGAQVKSEILMFMTADALTGFRNSKGWEAGVDGSVALVTLGAGGEIDTETIQEPIIGFIFSNKGLMYNLSIEGSKITEIDK
jgi:lipid-binding SYLF domain-containing protein